MVVVTRDPAVVLVPDAAVDSSAPNIENSARLVAARRMASPAPTWRGRIGDIRGESTEGGRIGSGKRRATMGAVFTTVRDHALALRRRVRDSGLSLHAAAVAYHAFLALVPLTLALLGIAGLVGQSAAAVERLERALEPVVPESVVEFIIGLMTEAGERVGGSKGAFILVTAVIALYLGSRAMVALQRALGAVDHQAEVRGGASIRLVAIGLTIAGGLTLLITSLLLVAGREIFEFLGNLFGVGSLADLWAWLRVPISALGLFGFLFALYTFGRPRPLPRAWLAALVATGVALLGSLGFGFYLSAAPDLGPTFGTLGAVAVALVWLYVGALAILFGAVVAAYAEDGFRSS
jgi:membrane protein